MAQTGTVNVKITGDTSQLDERLRRAQADLAERMLAVTVDNRAVLAAALADLVSGQFGGRIACSRRRRLYRLRAWLARKLAP